MRYWHRDFFFARPASTSAPGTSPCSIRRWTSLACFSFFGLLSLTTALFGRVSLSLAFFGLILLNCASLSCAWLSVSSLGLINACSASFGFAWLTSSSFSSLRLNVCSEKQAENQTRPTSRMFFCWTFSLCVTPINKIPVVPKRFRRISSFNQNFSGFYGFFGT